MRRSRMELLTPGAVDRRYGAPMPLLTVAKFFATLASLAVLGVSGYLLWSWWDGDFVRAADGSLLIVRDDWRLWTALALLALSLFGRLMIVPLLARGGSNRSDEFKRLAGRSIAGACSPALHVEASGATNAPVIVLTHGQGMDTSFWAPIRQQLAKQY